MKNSILLVEDDERLRKRLVKILNTAPDLACPWAASSAEEVLADTFDAQPRVILLDINLPGMSGIECLPAIRKKFSGAEVLMLTAYENGDDVFDSLKRGASGYLVKSNHSGVLFDAIREVIAGGSPLSGHIARKVVEYFQSGAQPGPVNPTLSPRELEVLDLLASGHIYKEITDRLNISLPTVRTYIRRICEKLHVRSRSEAIAKYRP